MIVRVQGLSVMLTMTTDKNVSKVFIIERTLTITQPANGTITDGGSVECGSASTAGCIVKFDHGTEVRLTATPDANYEPGAWGQACASVTDAGATCTVTMDTDKTVNKVFSIIQHTLTITEPTNGTITDGGSVECGSASTAGCIVKFDHGTEVRLTATPEANYGLGDWGDDCSGPSATCTVAMTANRTVSKVFIIQRTLTITQPTGGKITSNPPGIDCGDVWDGMSMALVASTDCVYKFNMGTEVTLTSTAPPGIYSDGDWGDACVGKSANAACTLTMMDADITVSKQYEAD